MEGTPKAGEGAGKARSWGVTSLVIQHSSLTLLFRSDSNTRGIAKGMEGKHYSRWKTSPTRVKNEKKELCSKGSWNVDILKYCSCRILSLVHC